ncbi:1,4-dihydroxy-2-naphthoate polyprenyltransferase [Aquimarina agarivorans]|uniref:1,4-dihydroxy-2-naphthoate polyprenyltransferase n=1 Tax=Aquimarina agarivorans TaxID=980584 RepID=UPI000248F2F1|nr:1,4-dihydroxy-2-naphthoate polyprenyltransferase [Aquimarina agarivorans]
MNKTTKAWFQAARLRTLPLSVSGIITGTVVAAYQGFFDVSIFIGALITTVGLQVLSNFANDYGDGVKGTDNNDRIGPKRALQSGAISAKTMKKGIIITALITLAAALILIYVAFKNTNLGYSLLFVALGVSSIIAAIKYTVGKSAYGYNGLGDIFVFLFFGLLSVMGSYFLYAKQLYWPLWFPAVSIGLLSTAVLNLNNMRDREGDQKAGKNTLVVAMGFAKAKKYHYSLLIVAMFCMLIYTIITYTEISHWIYIVCFAPLIKHLRFVQQTNAPIALDPELKKVALTTFSLSLLFGLSLLVWA